MRGRTGRKSVMLGGVALDYREMQALVASVELSGVGRVLEAPRSGRCCDGLGTGRAAADRDVAVTAAGADHGLGLYVVDVGAPLADCLRRLLNLLAAPQEIPMLLPLLLREIYFRLLNGPHRDKFAMLGLPEAAPAASPTLAYAALRFRAAGAESAMSARPSSVVNMCACSG